MADPRRYYIDPDGDKLAVVASPSGDWIKWPDFEDYKAAQRRNASAEMNTKLGVEIAEMRVLIEEMNNTINISQAKCRELKEENERLRKAGDAMRDCVDSDIFPNIIAAWNAAKEGGDR